MLVDLRPKRLTGKVAEVALGRAHITCNKNGIPFDPEKPTVTSGIRLGTPAGTTRGFGIAEFRQVGDMIAEVLDVLSQKQVEEDSLVEAAVRDKVKKLVGAFPDLPVGVRVAMRCPSCASLDTQVKDSRPTEDSAAIRRRRVCLTCNFRFTTFERVQLRELVVIKRNGRRVPFDRDKLMRSIQIALRKRNVDPERVEQTGLEDRARTGKSRRERDFIGDHRRDGDGASAHARRRRLCAVRLGLPQFPRAEGFRGRARGIVRRRGGQGGRHAAQMSAAK